MSWFPWKKDKRMHNWEEEAVDHKPVTYSTSTPLPEPQEFKPPTEAEKMRAITEKARKEKAEMKDQMVVERLEVVRREIRQAAAAGDLKYLLDNRGHQDVILTEEELYEHFEKHGFYVEKGSRVPYISWE